MADLAVLAGQALVDGQLTGPVTLTIADGRIASIDPPRSEGVIDASAATVVPGLLDIHTHGGGGVQVIDGPAADMDRLARFYAAHGVTGFLATIGGSREHIMAGLGAVRSYLAASPSGGARCLGVHLEGPFISPHALGAFRPESALAPDAELFAEVLDAAGGHIRLMTIAPELAGADAIIERALAEGIACTIGHSVATLAQVDHAVDIGARSVTHFFNGMSPFRHREPGLIGAGLTDPRLVCELIVDGIHVHPRAVALAALAKGIDGIALITDSISAAGMPDGEYELEEQHVIISAGSARLADGTLAGSMLTLERGVANFAAWAKVPLADAVRSATEVPARVIGLSSTRGRISRGRDADLTAFDSDHRLLWTMVGGALHEPAAA